MQEPWKTQFQNLNEPLLPSAELLQTTRLRMAAAKPQKWLPRLQKTLAVAACTCLIFVGAVNLVAGLCLGSGEGAAYAGAGGGG